MGYVRFTEVDQGRGGSVDQRYQRSYKRVFLVETDNPGYGPYYAGSHPSIPAVWSIHPEDPLAYCVGFNVENDQGDPTLWRITANYSYNADTAYGGGPGTGPTGNPAIDTQQQGIAPADRVQNPLSRPRDYQINTVGFPEAAPYDIKGNPIVNSAGDPFLPVAERMRYNAIINLGLNNLTPPSESWYSSLGRVNANTVTFIMPNDTLTCAAKTLKLTGLNSVAAHENGVSYWRWSLTFEYKPFNTTWTTPGSITGGWVQTSGTTWPRLGHMLILIDQGKREYYAGTGKWKDITTEPNYAPVSQPVLFDGTGFKLANNQLPYYKAWDIYESVTFPSPL